MWDDGTRGEAAAIVDVVGLEKSYEAPVTLRAGPCLDIVEDELGGPMSPVAVPEPVLAAIAGLFMPLFEEARLLRGSKTGEDRTAAFLGWMIARLLKRIEAGEERAAALSWLTEPCVDGATEVETP